jgi:geranylgeranyl diphosphate synthase, type II
MDDVLDATSDRATLGKTPGKDARADKTTYVKLHGVEGSRRRALQHSEAARTALRSLPGDTEFLAALVASLAGRDR